MQDHESNRIDQGCQKAANHVGIKTAVPAQEAAAQLLDSSLVSSLLRLGLMLALSH